MQHFFLSKSCIAMKLSSVWIACLLVISFVVIYLNAETKPNIVSLETFLNTNRYDSNYIRFAAKDFSSWGFMNEAREIIIPLGTYKFLNPIDEKGMILAKKENSEGFIDIKENILIPFIYDKVGVFSESADLAPVIKGNKHGFINRNGDIIIPLEYDALHLVYHYASGLAILSKNGKYGVIDLKNEVIIPFEYDKIEWSKAKDSFFVRKGKELANFSLEGKRLFGSENIK